MEIKNIKPTKSPLRSADIHALRIFKSVVEYGSIKASAEALNVDLSTISRQIKDLEIRLGITLCRRGRSGFMLTEEGHAIYDISCDLVREINNSEDRIESVRSRLSGVLNIGVVDHLMANQNFSLHKIIRDVYDVAPLLNISYKIMSHAEIDRALLNGQLHIGIAGASDQNSDIEYLTLFEERHKLYCGKEHPLFSKRNQKLSKNYLKGHEYASRQHNSKSDVIAKEMGLIPGTVADGIESITILVLSSLYLGFLPTHYIESLYYKEELFALDIEGVECLIPFVVKMPKKTWRNPATSLFIKHLRKAVDSNY